MSLASTSRVPSQVPSPNYLMISIPLSPIPTSLHRLQFEFVHSAHVPSLRSLPSTKDLSLCSESEREMLFRANHIVPNMVSIDFQAVSLFWGRRLEMGGRRSPYGSSSEEIYVLVGVSAQFNEPPPFIFSSSVRL
jgi:hypothetical protein